jgi:hypothetical protein
MEQPTQIFICHSRHDTARVEELYLRLLQQGFQPWLDSRDVSQVADWRSSVRDAIRESDFFLVCLSKNTVNNRGRVDEEMRTQLTLLWRGSSRGTYLIPVRLEECKVPEELMPFEVVDMFEEGGWLILLRQIADVKSRRNQLMEAFDHLSERVAPPPDPASRPTHDGSDVESLLDGPEDSSSVFEWSVELRRVLNGEREDVLRKLGGVEEYIEVTLAESEDPPLAEAAFHEALRHLVQAWQPSLAEPNYSTVLMLELIAVYSPPEGLAKVVALLDTLKTFGDEVTVGLDHEETFDLHLKSLVVLENYYDSPPKPPKDESPAYKAYVALLREDLLNQKYCGYVAGRLVDLRVTELSDPDVGYVIERYPDAVRGLVSVLLDPSRRSVAARDLAYVYMRCLDGADEVERAFEDAVVSIGGALKREDAGPIIELPGNAVLRLMLTHKTMDQYYELTLRREGEVGLKKYSSLSQSV